MNAHPHNHDGELGTVYVLHLEPAYEHARHYLGWARDVNARVAEHLARQRIAAGTGRRGGRPASRARRDARRVALPRTAAQALAQHGAAVPAVPWRRGALGARAARPPGAGPTPP